MAPGASSLWPKLSLHGEEQDRARDRGRPLAPWVQISSFLPGGDFQKAVRVAAGASISQICSHPHAGGSQDGQEPHTVLMSLKNTEQKITAQRLSGCRLSSCRQPLAKRLGRIKQMEPLWNNSVCAPFPTTAKEKVSAYFICSDGPGGKGGCMLP